MTKWPSHYINYSYQVSDKLKAPCLSFAKLPTLNHSFFQIPWFMWLQGKRWHLSALGSEARKGDSQKTWYPLTFRLQLFVWMETQSREQCIYSFSSLETDMCDIRRGGALPWKKHSWYSCHGDTPALLEFSSGLLQITAILWLSSVLGPPSAEKPMWSRQPQSKL